jgi:hypothetical protein
MRELWLTILDWRGERRDERPRFTGLQIAFALQQAEQNTPVAEVLRKMGIRA